MRRASYFSALDQHVRVWRGKQIRSVVRMKKKKMISRFNPLEKRTENVHLRLFYSQSIMSSDVCSNDEAKIRNYRRLPFTYVDLAVLNNTYGIVDSGNKSCLRS